MFNIGIDFGSTYTTVSAYRNETEKLETVVLGLGTPCLLYTSPSPRDTT